MTQDEWLDFCEQHERETQEIRNKPIELWWGRYCCYVDKMDGLVHHVIRKKKNREYVSIQSPIQVRGGKGNQVVWNWYYQYTDKDGNVFTDLTYYENEEVTREEWLGIDKVVNL